MVFVSDPRGLADADLVVLPGTRATIDDLAWLRDRGLDQAVLRHAAAGRPGMDFYELRHYCATRLLEAGCSLEDVAEQLDPVVVLGHPTAVDEHPAEALAVATGATMTWRRAPARSSRSRRDGR